MASVAALRRTLDALSVFVGQFHHKASKVSPEMPKPRQRVCLESGLKLDLNKLRRQGGVQAGAKIGPNVIRWTNTYTGEETASGLITANMEGQFQGWFRIQLGSLDQWIDLIPSASAFRRAPVVL